MCALFGLAVLALPVRAGAQTGLQVQVKGVEYTRITLTVQSPSKARVSVLHGIDKEQMIPSAPTDYALAHEVTVSAEGLNPGGTMYYQVLAQTEDGTPIEGTLSQVTTKGYPVRLLVTDRRDTPVRNHPVKLHHQNKTGTTDSNGFVAFDDLPAGQHTLELTQNNTAYAQTFDLAAAPVATPPTGSQTVPTQELTVSFRTAQIADDHDSSDSDDSGGMSMNINSLKKIPSAVTYIAAGLALAIVVGVGILMIVRHRKANQLPDTHNFPDSQMYIETEPDEEPTTQSAAPDPLGQVPGVHNPDPGTIVAPPQTPDDNPTQQPPLPGPPGTLPPQ